MGGKRGRAFRPLPACLGTTSLTPLSVWRAFASLTPALGGIVGGVLQAWKPPRAHHCSLSGRCVLKMDHYCVWVANTVGLCNYKAFVLFLCWAFAGCLLR